MAKYFHLVLLALTIGCGQLHAETNAISATKFIPPFTQPAIPDEENAAVQFQKAASLLVIRDEEHDSDWIPGVRMGIAPGNFPLSPEVSNVLAAVVDRNSKVIPEFRKAAALKRSAYPIGWTNGTYILPHLLKPCRTSSQFLSWSSLLSTIRGEEGPAVDSLLLIFSVGESLRDEPFLVSQAVRTRCTADAIEGIQHIFNRLKVSRENLAALQKRLNELELKEVTGMAFANALAMEKEAAKAFFATSVSNQAKVLVDLGYGRDIEESARRSHVESVLANNLNADRKFLLETYEEIERLWAAPYPARFIATEYAGSRAQQVDKEKLFHSHFFLSDSRSMLSCEARGLILLRLARIAVALEQYRLDHHNLYPPFLSHLTPKYLDRVPLDPLNGKPLLYRKQGRGYTAGSTWKAKFKHQELPTFTVVSAPQ